MHNYVRHSLPGSPPHFDYSGSTCIQCNRESSVFCEVHSVFLCGRSECLINHVKGKTRCNLSDGDHSPAWLEWVIRLSLCLF